jgi:hypothetical protein
MSDAPLTTCESCGGALKKKMFPVGIVFKGPGFYVNDYANKGSAKTTADAAKADTTTETKAEAKTESTPAATTETKTDTAPKAESKPVAAATA